MAESALNTRLMKILKPYHAVRIENSACPGTPDIECTLGWIEDKFLDHWPKAGVVKCDHYTPQQRVWAIRRSRATGPGRSCFLMLQVGREYLLFIGEVAAEHLGRVDEATLRKVAFKSWVNKIDPDQFVNALLEDIYGIPDGF